MLRHSPASHGRARRLLAAASVALACLFSHAAAPGQTPTPAPSPNDNPTPTATQTATPTQTPTRTATPAASPVAAANVAPGAQAAAPLPDLSDVVRVTKVYNMRYLGAATTDPEYVERQRAGLNDIIIVEVRNLEALLRRAKCLPPYDQPKPCREQEVALYLNGRPIRGLRPESGAPALADPNTNAATAATASSSSAPPPIQCGTAESPSVCRDGRLRYHLQRLTDSANGADNQEHWADLLGFSSDYGDWDNLERPVEVSVGLGDEYPLGTDVKATKPCTAEGGGFCLTRVRKWRLLIWLVLAVVCLLFLFWLTRKFDLLCDRRPVLWGKKRPYSLSAVQAAWWFVLVLFSFVFIWMVTGQQDLSATALVLVSIGLGTALGATVIDANKGHANDTAAAQDALGTLLSQKRKLEEELDGLVSSGAAQAQVDAKKAEYDRKIAELRGRFPQAIGPSRAGFIFDILSDDNGVSFHRFQMFVWTFVLGIFFVISALGALSMPNFSTTLLGLMGVSAGTYLGFKIPEAQTEGAGQQSSNPPTPPPATPPPTPAPPATTPTPPAPPAQPPATAGNASGQEADGGQVDGDAPADAEVPAGADVAADEDAAEDGAVAADENADDDSAGAVAADEVAETEGDSATEEAAASEESPATESPRRRKGTRGED